jgi:hypothetical protein
MTTLEPILRGHPFFEGPARSRPRAHHRLRPNVRFHPATASSAKAMRPTVLPHPRGPGLPMTFAPGQFNMLYAFGVGEVPISISGDPASRRLSSTPSARRQRSPRRCAARPGRPSACAARSARPGRWRRPRARRRRRGRRHRPGAAAPGDLPRCSPPRATTAASSCSTARAARTTALPDELAPGARRLDLEVASRGPRRPPRGAATSASSPRSSPPVRSPPDAVALVCGPEVMMRFTVRELARAACPDERDLRLDGAQHEVRRRLLRPLPARPEFVCKDGPVFRYDDRIALACSIREI